MSKPTDWSALYNPRQLALWGLQPVGGLDPAQDMKAADGIFRGFFFQLNDLLKIPAISNAPLLLICCDVLAISGDVTLPVAALVFARRVEIKPGSRLLLNRATWDVPLLLYAQECVAPDGTAAALSVLLVTPQGESPVQPFAPPPSLGATGISWEAGNEIPQGLSGAALDPAFLLPSEPLHISLTAIFQAAAMLSQNQPILAISQWRWVAALAGVSEETRLMASQAAAMAGNAAAMLAAGANALLVPPLDLELYAASAQAQFAILDNAQTRLESWQKMARDDKNWIEAAKTTLALQSNQQHLSDQLLQQAQATKDQAENARLAAGLQLSAMQAQVLQKKFAFDHGVFVWKQQQQTQAALDIVTGVVEIAAQIPTMIVAGPEMAAMPAANSLADAAKLGAQLSGTLLSGVVTIVNDSKRLSSLISEKKAPLLNPLKPNSSVDAAGFKFRDSGKPSARKNAEAPPVPADLQPPPVPDDPAAPPVPDDLAPPPVPADPAAPPAPDDNEDDADFDIGRRPAQPAAAEEDEDDADFDIGRRPAVPSNAAPSAVPKERNSTDDKKSFDEKNKQQKELVESAKKAGEGAQRVVDGALRLAEIAAAADRLLARSSDILDDSGKAANKGLGSIQLTGINVATGGSQDWELFRRSVEDMFDGMPQLNEIPGGVDYRGSIRDMIICGQALCQAKLALARANSDLAEAKLRSQAEERATGIASSQLDHFAAQSDEDARIIQLISGKIMDCKRAVWLTLESYNRAYRYFTLSPLSPLPQLADPVDAFRLATSDVASRQKQSEALLRNAGRPQPFNIPMQITDPGMLNNFRTTGCANFLIGPEADEFAGLGRCRLHRVRVFAQFSSGAPVSGLIEVRIATSGAYTDKIPGTQSIGAFVSQACRWAFVYDIQNPQDIRLDGAIANRFEDDFFAPTPFTQWTIGFSRQDGSNVDLSSLVSVRIEFSGEATPL